MTVFKSNSTYRFNKKKIFFKPFLHLNRGAVLNKIPKHCRLKEFHFECYFNRNSWIGHVATVTLFWTSVAWSCNGTYLQAKEN